MSIQRRVISAVGGGFRVLYSTDLGPVRLRSVLLDDHSKRMRIHPPEDQPQVDMTGPEAIELYLCLSDAREMLLDLGTGADGNGDKYVDAYVRCDNAYRAAFATLPLDHPLRPQLKKGDVLAENLMIEKGGEAWLNYRYFREARDALVGSFEPDLTKQEFPVSWVGDDVSVVLDRVETTVQLSVRKANEVWVSLGSAPVPSFTAAVARCVQHMGMLDDLLRAQYDQPARIKEAS